MIQRFRSAANLNIHPHCLVLDGVYRRTDQGPVFVVDIASGTLFKGTPKGNSFWGKEMIAGNTATRAIKRDAAPEDMAGGLIYLCGADSDFVTGQSVVVDGAR